MILNEFIKETSRNQMISILLKHYKVGNVINHAMDAKMFGWKKFKEMYEMEMNLQITNGKDPYEDNKFEIQAEEFGQKMWKTWKSKFKKQNLI